MALVNNIGNNLNPVDRAKEQERVQSSKADRARRTSQSQRADSAAAPRDSVDISSEAKQLAASESEIARLQNQLQALGQRDESKIAEIRQRVENGDFEQPEVVEAVAETIVNLPQFNNLADGSPDVRREPANVDAVAARIQSGDFNSDQILEQVAANILNDIGAF